jgi:hypothetical protein
MRRRATRSVNGPWCDGARNLRLPAQKAAPLWTAARPSNPGEPRTPINREGDDFKYVSQALRVGNGESAPERLLVFRAPSSIV